MPRFLMIFSALAVATLGFCTAQACTAASYDPSTYPTVEIRTTEATVGRHLWLRLNVYCAGPEGAACDGIANLTYLSLCCPARTHPPLGHVRHYSLLAGTERPIALQLRSKIERRLQAVALFTVSRETVRQHVVLRPSPR